MGVSSDGILVYGIPCEEDALPEFLEEFEGDFDEYLESISGLPKWGEPGHDFAAQRAFRDACPVDFVAHCSYDYPMYIIAVRAAQYRNSRGSVTEPDTFDVPLEKLHAFTNWCTERGITGKPRWCLVSMYG
ncbi:MAG: hypothetical protein E5Y05_00220 [Mesorhizobium sp.]|nr:MAG: hypothetical protein E5Y05_00220 [Mesorhizobium sp.]